MLGWSLCYALAAAFVAVHGSRPFTPPRAGVLGGARDRVTPLFGVSRGHDSNPLLDVSGSMQGDFITRVSPGIEGEHRSPRFSLMDRYVLDLERFATHPELSTADGRQQATIDLRTSRSRRLEFAVDAAFARTRTPGDLSAGTGLTLARAPAEHVEAHPAIVRQVNPVTEATIDYYRGPTNGSSAGSRAVPIGQALASIGTYRGADVVEVNYGIRMFLFEPDMPADFCTSVIVGWSRQITRDADVELRGGACADRR